MIALPRPTDKYNLQDETQTRRVLMQELTDLRAKIDLLTATYLPLAGGTLTGNLLFSTDNTKDIGATGATRPRTGYFGTSVISPIFTVTNVLKLKAYTVATLPAGAVGDVAYVTDATAPAYLAALVGGGAVVCPVFYNGAAWVST